MQFALRNLYLYELHNLYLYELHITFTYLSVLYVMYSNPQIGAITISRDTFSSERTINDVIYY